MILLSWHSGEAREFCPIIDSPRHCARLARAVLVGMNFSKTTQAAHIVCSSYLSPYFTMASHKYYDLSSDDNGSYGNHYGDSSCSSSEDDDDDNDYGSSSNATNGQDPLWGRTILHLDIDCFYVQAEEIERGLRKSDKPIPPMAIGQKHIIVSE